MPLSYNKLDPSAKQIRLLTIFPDENDENPVRASLHTVSLNDTCDFEALSYVWGDTSVTVDISVDDCIVGVTPNLHAFLRGLRQPDTERTVWVDYVCINQGDISERNSQVVLMYQIYSTARSVVAWLGDLEPVALKLVEWFHANEDGLYIASTGLGPLESILVLCVAAKALCAAQYWHRLWTFQEWHLSRNAVVCMHEKTTFTIGNIFKQLYQEIFVARIFIASMLGEASSEANTYTENLYKNILLLRAMQQDLDSLLNKIPRDILRLNPGTPCPSGLGDLLLLTVDRLCSNRLDNVYALYGLSPSARETYPPDYRKTISQVSHETTSFVLGHEANMSIFNGFDFSFNSFNQDDSLPSWVVDFTTKDPEHRAKMQQSFSKSLYLNNAPWKPIQDLAPIITDDM
ncbi:HET domain-containing protein, partial [Aspergillus vadensis CBS 113365]